MFVWNPLCAEIIEARLRFDQSPNSCHEGHVDRIVPFPPLRRMLATSIRATARTANFELPKRARATSCAQVLDENRFLRASPDEAVLPPMDEAHRGASFQAAPKNR